MCRIDYCDGDEGMWLAEPHERVARKPHGCQDCGRTIDPGERYTAGTWAWSNAEGLVTLKMCAQCVAAGRWLRVVCGGHFWPGVVDELVEHWEEELEYRSLGLGRLIVAARKRWRRHGRLVLIEEIDAWVDHALTHVPAVARG